MSKKAFRYVPFLAEFSPVMSLSTLLSQYETGYCTHFKSCKHTYNSVLFALLLIFAKQKYVSKSV